MPSTDRQEKNITETEQRQNLHDTGKTGNYQDTGKSCNYQDTGKDTNFQGTNLQDTNLQDTNLQDTKDIKQGHLQEQKETDNLHPKDQEKVDSAMSDFQKETNERLNMQYFLCQAHESLKKFLNPELVDVKKQIPVKLLSGAKALLFLTVVKTGIVVGGAVGTGIMMTRLDDRKWSGPCAIGMYGSHFGIKIGDKKTDYVIVLRDNCAFDVFLKQGEFKFGEYGSIAAGPEGRDASIDKDSNSIVWYSMAKGIDIGKSLEGQVIVVRNVWNEEFYQHKVQPREIFEGSGKIPDNNDFNCICDLLDKYMSTPLESLHHTQQ